MHQKGYIISDSSQGFREMFGIEVKRGGDSCTSG